jgi:hypothetical protein
LKNILDPRVARLKFESEKRAIGSSPHPVPQYPTVSWRVVKVAYPLLVAELAGPTGRLIRAVADCTNYDYDPPLIHFRTVQNEPIPWRNLQLVARTYPHPKGLFHDVTMYPDGEGFVCREGHFGYHTAHHEINWLDIRATEKGRLFAIVENAFDSLDLKALAGIRLR